MPVSEREAANAWQMIDLCPGRREYFDALLHDLETQEIAGAADPSRAIDAYAARLIKHIRGLGDHSNVRTAREFEEKWQQGGFSDGAIREVTFKLLEGDRFFTDKPLKYLVYAVFRSRGALIEEIEAMGAHFQTGIQCQDLGLLDYLADQSDEMYGKRPVDLLVSRAANGHGRLVEFLDTDEGYQLRVFGAVGWFCNSRYGDIVLRPMLSEYCNDPVYREYSKDPTGYCQRASERWLQTRG